MRRVGGGSLKLQLAQYRDLEAFAQFGSDLDAETRATLARGERLVRALNQNERHPMPVEDQVVQIYAATHGYVDRILVEKVPRFLSELTESVRNTDPDLLKKIAGGDWEDATQSRTEELIRQFAEDFGYDLDEEGLPLDEDRQMERRGGSSASRSAEDRRDEEDQAEAA